QTRILTRSPASAAVPVEPSRSGPTVVRSGGRRTHPPAEIVAIEADAVIVVDSATGNTKRVLATQPGAGSGGAVSLRGVALTPDHDEHQSALYQESSITEMAWAPDSARLAYTLAYEGDSVSILDTSRHKDLAETTELVVPGGGGDSRHPAWQASSGRLAVVNSA